MARSDLDLEHGDAIRAGELVACPHCGVEAVWHSMPEYADHRRLCARLELGLIVGTMPLHDDMIPITAKKPRGYDWV